MEKQYNANVVLDIAMEIGLNLLKCGAEISRVEETITYICKSYGASSIDVFAIPTMVMATIELDSETYTSKIRRNLEVSNDLYRIEKYNQLSRDIAKDRPSLDEVKEKIKHIQEKKDYNLFILYLGGIFATFGFAMFFGGSWRDGIAAAIVGIIIMFFNRLSIFEKQKTFHTLLSSLIGGLFSVLLCLIHLGENVSYVMIGGVMVLIPGIYIGTSIKDIIYGDMLSGSVRLLQAFVQSVAIAAGFSIWLIVFKQDIALNNLNPIYITLIASLLGTLGFAIIFNIKYNRILYVCIGGVLTALIYLLFVNYVTDSPFIPTLVACAFGSLYSEIFARILKMPTICLILPTVIILVPGASLFFTMSYLVRGQSNMCLTHLFNTLLASLALALGIIIASILTQSTHLVLTKIKAKRK